MGIYKTLTRSPEKQESISHVETALRQTLETSKPPFQTDSVCQELLQNLHFLPFMRRKKLSVDSMKGLFSKIHEQV